jgi:hypothetical protein
MGVNALLAGPAFLPLQGTLVLTITVSSGKWSARSFFNVNSVILNILYSLLECRFQSVVLFFFPVTVDCTADNMTVCVVGRDGFLQGESRLWKGGMWNCELYCMRGKHKSVAPFGMIVLTNALNLTQVTISSTPKTRQNFWNATSVSLMPHRIPTVWPWNTCLHPLVECSSLTMR